MRITRLLTIPLVIIVTVVAVDRPRSTAQTASDALSEFEAAALVRAINTAQAELLLGKKPYASLRELQEHRLFQRNWISARLSLSDEYTATIRGYKVSVVVSEDRRHYAVALVPETATGCEPAFFSSEAAVIYRAQAFGCSEESK